MAVADRIAVPSFVGGSNRLVSPNASVETSINLYPEATAPSVGGKVQQYLRGSEGIQRFAEVSGVAPQLFFQNERCFAATNDPGAAFSEIFDDGTSQLIGTINSDGRPATMCSNGTAGNQILIAAGLTMYVYDLVTSVFQNMDIGENVEMVEFWHGYGMALIRATRQVRYSDLEDFLTWPALSVFEKNFTSDNISAMKRMGPLLWLIGNKNTEVWSNTGDTDIPFAPVPGVEIDEGCVAPFSAVRDGNAMCWLTQDERGGAQVVRASGFQPEDISTYAINGITWDNQGGNSQAIMFAHQMQGHRFLWLQLVSDETTPVLDQVQGLWHERRMWMPDDATWVRHLGISHAYAFEKHLIGDATSGLIYELSPDFLDDDV